MKKFISAAFMALAAGPLCSLSGLAMEPIQTQPSSDGKFEASLTSAKVRRDVLTVKIRLKNIATESAKLEFKYKSVYVTDIEEKKKYFALKDSAGTYIAGPQDRSSEGGKVERYIDAGGQAIVWVKFPAPPEATQTVDIFVPRVLPFEEIEIER